MTEEKKLKFDDATLKPLNDDLASLNEFLEEQKKRGTQKMKLDDATLKPLNDDLASLDDFLEEQKKLGNNDEDDDTDELIQNVLTQLKQENADMDEVLQVLETYKEQLPDFYKKGGKRRTRKGGNTRRGKGGKRARGRKTRRLRGGNKSASLKQVDINTVVNCTNQKYGCDLKAKQFTCYKRVKTELKKTGADKIIFTNSRKKTKRIKPVLRVGQTWYDCSHFKK